MKIGNLTVSMYREESPATGKIVAALCAAHPEFPRIQFDSTGWRDGESYRYASIAAIRRAVMPVLARNGVWMQHIYGESDSMPWVTTILRHTSGEYLTSTLRVPQIADIQERKAAMTLLCRTAIEGLLSIATEEDSDGQGVQDVGVEQAEPVDPATQKRWRANLELAAAAIGVAPDAATLEKYRGVAEKRIASGDMAPDALEQIDEAVEARAKQLTTKKEENDDGHDNASGNEDANAARGRRSGANRKRATAGTGA